MKRLLAILLLALAGCDLCEPDPGPTSHLVCIEVEDGVLCAWTGGISVDTTQTSLSPPRQQP